jgi:hypothetical protein
MLQSGTYTNLVEALTSTYVNSDMCSEPAQSRGWIDPGSLHTAVLGVCCPDLSCLTILPLTSSY